MTPTHIDTLRQRDFGTNGYSVDDQEQYPGEPSVDFEYHCLDLAARRRGICYYMWFCLKEAITGKRNTSL